MPVSGDKPQKPIKVRAQFTHDMAKRRTNINLSERHVEWAKENNKNLSATVRELLDKEIDD